MKNYLTIISAFLFMASCDKPVHNTPTMNYIDLENKEVKFHELTSVDLNKDGVMDVRFHTLLVGDPIAQQDKRKYFATSLINCRLPVNANENAPMLSKGESIPLNNFSGYEWYEIALVELAQKVTGMTGDPYWEGLWKATSHKYLPVLVLVNRQRYTAWVELSFDTTAEKIILHKAAISKIPERDAIAGI